jgi:hypothetical protein
MRKRNRTQLTAEQRCVAIPMHANAGEIPPESHFHGIVRPGREQLSAGFRRGQPVGNRARARGGWKRRRAKLGFALNGHWHDFRQFLLAALNALPRSGCRGIFFFLCAGRAFALDPCLRPADRPRLDHPHHPVGYLVRLAFHSPGELTVGLRWIDGAVMGTRAKLN